MGIKNNKMDHIFYFLAIFPILWESISAVDTVKVHNKLTKSAQKDKDKMENKDVMLALFMVGYAIWGIAGLFSTQWPLFVALLLLSVVPKKIIILRRIDAILSLLILCFIVINKYHLHIDILG